MITVALTEEDLINTFEVAKEKGTRYIGILIKNENYQRPAVVIHRKEDFDKALQSYLNTYEEGLVDKFTGAKRIICFTAQDWADDIMFDFDMDEDDE